MSNPLPQKLLHDISTIIISFAALCWFLLALWAVIGFACTMAEQGMGADCWPAALGIPAFVATFIAMKIMTKIRVIYVLGASVAASSLGLCIGLQLMQASGPHL